MRKFFLGLMLLCASAFAGAPQQLMLGGGAGTKPGVFVTAIDNAVASPFTYNALTADSSGNIVAIGTYSAATTLAIVSSYGATGSHSWSRKLTGSTSLTGNAVATDASNNVFVTGSGAGQSVTLVKYNSSGTLQWQRKLTSSSTTITARGVVVDSSGSPYVALTLSSSSHVGYLIKYNSSGTLQWQRKLSLATTPVDLATAGALGIDGSDNLYVCAASDSLKNALLVKYNSSGTVQWQTSLINTGSDTSALSCAVNASGTSIVANNSANYGVASYNSSGTLLWQVNSVGSATTLSAAVDSSGNGYLAVSALDDATSTHKVALITKLSAASGAVVFQRHIDYSTGLLQTNQMFWSKGRMFLAGQLTDSLDGIEAGFVWASDSGGSHLFSGTSIDGGTLTYRVPTPVSFSTSSYASGTTVTDAAGTLTDAAGTLTDAAFSVGVTDTVF